MYTENALLWLETLFFERFGAQFSLKEAEDSLVLNMPERLGRVIFDRLEPMFHQSSSGFPVDHWDAESEGFVAVSYTHLTLPTICSV